MGEPVRFREEDGKSDARLSVVERAVADLADAIKGVSKQVDSIRDSIVTSGKTNWGLVISMVGVLFVIIPTVGGLIWFGVAARLDSMKVSQEHTQVVLDERSGYLRELAEDKGKMEERTRWLEKGLTK